MKQKKAITAITVALMLAALLTLFATPTFAAGDVAGAVESTWTAAKDQMNYPAAEQRGIGATGHFHANNDICCTNSFRYSSSLP